MGTSLEITGSALAAIAGHLDDLRKGSPGEDWLPALIWGERGVQESGETEWQDLGVGFSLGFYPRNAVPLEALTTYGHIDIALINATDDAQAFDGKRVILDSGKFVLAD